MRVAVVSTHPIQYHSPWFRELAKQNIELKIYYALIPDEQQQGVGFGDAFAWDIPLLEGYEWSLIPNKRRSPNLASFGGSSTPQISSILAEYKPDALVITGWQSLPLLQALYAAIRLGIPRIVRGDSNALRPRPAMVRTLHRLLLSRFQAFLSTGKLNHEFYRGYGVDPRRIFPCHHFVDNNRFALQYREHSTRRQSLRRGWGMDQHNKQVCFLFVGKLQPKKRLIDLLRAIEIASRENKNIYLLVVGAGEQMSEAERFVSSRNLPVTFAGFLNQTEITKAYAAADCLVLPSDYGETWGLVVNEAMACGLPAIVSDRVGCGPDLVEEDVTGAIVPCADVEFLARKLVEFASSSEKLIRMGENAGRRVAQYSVDGAVAGTLQAIEFVTGQPGVADRQRWEAKGARSSIHLGT